LQLAVNAADPLAKQHYQQIAENYLALAQAEELLAERLEMFGPDSSPEADQSKPHEP
jgi:hypothetical protein